MPTTLSLRHITLIATHVVEAENEARRARAATGPDADCRLVCAFAIWTMCNSSGRGASAAGSPFILLIGSAGRPPPAAPNAGDDSFHVARNRGGAPVRRENRT
ncbi:hypothetical protein VTO73DRAFT_8106 [Trametes versicolor]